MFINLRAVNVVEVGKDSLTIITDIAGDPDGEFAVLESERADVLMALRRLAIAPDKDLAPLAPMFVDLCQIGETFINLSNVARAVMDDVSPPAVSQMTIYFPASSYIVEGELADYLYALLRSITSKGEEQWQMQKESSQKRSKGTKSR